MSLAAETRPERLLAPAASAEVRHARGICPLCGLSREQCERALDREFARLDSMLGFFGLSEGARS